METVILKGYPLTHKNHPRHTEQDEKGRKKLPREKIKKGNMFSHRAKKKRVSEAQRKQEKQYKWEEGIKVLEDGDWSGFV